VRCRILLTLLLLITLSGAPGVALGSSIYVQPGTDTIHAAVASASAGDAIRLTDGEYIITRTVVIDKNLTIRGDSADRTLVHIAAIDSEEFNFEGNNPLFSDPLDRGHMFFVTSNVQLFKLRDVTMKNAPETAIPEDVCEKEPPLGLGLNHSECMGDAIHSYAAGVVDLDRVELSLNAGNGLWVDGAATVEATDSLFVNNGAFGIDVDTADFVKVRQCEFTANQVSGVEASIIFDQVTAKGNGEIGLEVERFQLATLRDVVTADNREDGFDADRVDTVDIDNSSFLMNLDDGIEMFPAGTEVPPSEQPADFPGSVIEIFGSLTFFGNIDQDIERPPTED
jgi:hypothetical protein